MPTDKKGMRMDEKLTRERLVDLVSSQQKKHRGQHFVTFLTPQAEKDIEAWPEDDLGKRLFELIKQGTGIRKSILLLIGTRPFYDCTEIKVVLEDDLTKEENVRIFEQEHGFPDPFPYLWDKSSDHKPTTGD